MSKIRINFIPQERPDVLIAQNIAEQLLTEKQLAVQWNISIKTLQAQRWKGSGVAFIKLGRAVRYRVSDVAAYEQARVQTSTIEINSINQNRG